MNESAIENLEVQLKTCFQSQQQELVAYVIINQLSKDAPYAAGFSINLEKVMKHEIEFTIGQLIKLEIADAAALVLDR